MPIVISLTSVPTDIGNYSGLIATIVDTLKDDSLEERVPDFIALAEARFNRLLYPLNDETTATLTLAAGDTSDPLPTDFKKPRSLYYANDPSTVLKQLSPDDFNAKYLDATSGKPEAYCIEGANVRIGPEADAAYTLTLSYVRGLQGLSQSNQTNWLIENHPDLYFFGALMYAELDGWNDERAHDFDGAVDRIIGEIKFWDAQRRRGDHHDTVAGTYF